MSNDRRIVIEPLTREAFAPFGQVIDFEGSVRFPINAGDAQRIHDLAQVEVTGPNGRATISLVRGKPLALPLTLRMLEHHPLGTQAFQPLGARAFLVVVAPPSKEKPGTPGRPRAFLTAPGQGVNYARGTWHGLLTPLEVETDFLVVDRVGEGDNCIEHHFEVPWTIVRG